MKVKVKVKSLSRVRLFATPWTVAYQAPLSMGFCRPRVQEWVAISFSKRELGLGNNSSLVCIFIDELSRVRVGAKVAPQRPCSWGRKSVGRPPLLWFAAFFPHFGRGTNENAVLGSSGKRGASLVAHTVDNLPAMYETHV